MQKIVRTIAKFAPSVRATQGQKFVARELPTIKRGPLLLAWIALVALCSISPVRANEQVPFKGSFDVKIVGATPLDEIHVVLDVDVQAWATHLGKTRGPGFVVLDLTTLAYFGEANWAAANGDAVFLAFAGQFVLTDTPDLLENVETFEVAGGTGRFEGATGEGTASGLLDATTLEPLEPAPFVGTISSPGSLKK